MLAADPGAGGASDAAPWRNPAPPTVVIADNDPMVTELLRTDLALEGYDVVATVDDGDAAVAACALHLPEVLIVDYRMPPGPNGLATIAAVRAERTVGHAILYTNYRSSLLVEQAAKLGATLVAKGELRTLREALLHLTSPTDRPGGAQPLRSCG